MRRAGLVGAVALVVALGVAPSGAYGAGHGARGAAPAGVDYSYACTVTGLPGLVYTVVINVAGHVPATVHSGSTFVATGIMSTTTYPLTVTVLHGSLPVRASGATALTHTELVTKGPVVISGGVPFTSGPIKVRYRVTGAPGSRVVLRPGTVTADLVTYGHATCLLAAGQPAFARATIV